MKHPTTPRTQGFALPEIASILVVATIGMAIIIPALDDTRRQADLGRDIKNLRQIAQWTAMYALDNKNLYWTYSWEEGHQNSQWPDLNNSSNKVQAAGHQAVDILRRRTGRGSGPTMIAPGGSWLPHVLNSHLPLVDYLDRDLPDFAFISTADTHRLMWASDPLAFDQGAFLPFQPQPIPSRMRIPYSSSHRLSTSFFDGSPVGVRIWQFNHNQFVIPFANRHGTHVMGGMPLHDVSFPARKVHINFSESRYFNTYQFCVSDGARLPFLMADSSVQIHDADDADEGWQPNNPTVPEPTVFTYEPRLWEAPTSNGEPSEIVIGRFLWTRDFLAGQDFNRPNRPPRSKPNSDHKKRLLAEILLQLATESKPHEIANP